MADTSNHTIRKISPAGIVTTIAGLAMVKGSTDGAGTTARFNAPTAIAVDSSDNVYVSDTGNYTIRKISPTGNVTTLAGAVGKSSYADGQGSMARFVYVGGIAAGKNGNVFVADSFSRTIRKISPTGVVTTIAGSGTVEEGNINGNGTNARFRLPVGIAIDNNDNIFVCDSGSYTIRKISPKADVTTILGGFDCDGISVDLQDNIYATKSIRNIIKKLSPTGVVSILAGKDAEWGSVDGKGNAARFHSPHGISVGIDGNVYVADSLNSTIRKINSVGVVSTFAGTASKVGNTDGTGSAALFDNPEGITVDEHNNAYVTDMFNDNIRKISSTGVVTTLAGLRIPGESTVNDGIGIKAGFSWPSAITIDNSGYTYVADTANHTIRKISPSAVVTTLAGLAGESGDVDGNGATARFLLPSGITIDRNKNIYVADTRNSIIRKISPSGTVTTLAGLAGVKGSADGKGDIARFYLPTGITVDSSGNLYVVDQKSTVRKITPSGLVSTLPIEGGGVNFNLRKIVLDANGNFYIINPIESTILMARQVCDATTSGCKLQVLKYAVMYNAKDLAISSNGLMYITALNAVLTTALTNWR
ncbi:hypothetical protein ACFSHO_01380 [Acinetobacter vivianii]